MKNKHESFAEQWITAWNKHDINAILSHYEETIEFQSPFITQLNYNNSGIIHTKDALREYFEIGLHTYPELHFKLINVLSGNHSLVIYYESVNNKMAAEVFFLSSHGKASKVYCHYV